MKKIIRKLFLVVFSALVVIACKHQSVNVQPDSPGGTGNGTGTGGAGGGGTPPDTALCFERDILPIFKSNCTNDGCHGGKDNRSDYDFRSYAGIIKEDFVPFNPNRTKLWEAINRDENAGKDDHDDDDDHDVKDQRMPVGKDPLTKVQKDLIYRWIMQGAPNSKCASGCDTSQFTFAGAVQPLLSTNCTGCHSGTAPSGGISLNSYGGVRAVVDNNRLTGAIRHLPGYSPMPRSGGKLSDCQIAQIERWIASGAPNN